MLRWSIIFLILAAIAGVFGFTGLGATFAWLAKIFFYIFVAVFVIVLISSLFSKSSD